jgi:hypothetical protein
MVILHCETFWQTVLSSWIFLIYIIYFESENTDLQLI